MRKTRTLVDVYERCSFAVLELENFDVASKYEEWHVAIKEQIKMVKKNDTWQLVKKLDHRKLIGLKWVYKTKLNYDGSINKHKAILVVKGYAQEAGVDYIDMFAPVARHDTIRILIALATQRN